MRSHLSAPSPGRCASFQPRVEAGGVVTDQRDQGVGTGLVGRAIACQHHRQPERLNTKVFAQHLVVGRGRIAFVKKEVDDVQHVSQADGDIGNKRKIQCSLCAKALPGPEQPFLDGFPAH